MKAFFSKLIQTDGFNFSVAIIILINCILIGIEQSYSSEIIVLVQDLCIVLFVIEILIRWLARL